MKKIAYLGIPGSYSHVAATKYFAHDVSMHGVKTLAEIFAKLSNKIFDLAVVPLENTTTGSISDTYDLLLERKLSITGEIVLKIHHQLLANKNQKIEDIKNCYSHPQAISQCEGFFSKHIKINPKYTSDTASAADFISRKKTKGEAAIAGLSAAKIYKLKVLARNIEDNKNNYTRFVILSNKPNKEGDKVSLAFAVEHKPGCLFRALRAYAENNLNLTKIESRPLFGKPWEYIFYVDFLVHNQDKELAMTLSSMKEECQFVTVLGKYKKGKVYEA